MFERSTLNKRWLAAGAWLLTGLPASVYLGWSVAIRWYGPMATRARTVGDDWPNYALGALADLIGGLGAIVIGAPVLLLGPTAGLGLGLAVFAFIRSDRLQRRAFSFFNCRAADGSSAR